MRFSVDAGLIPVGELKGKKSVIFEIIFENMDNALAEGQNFFFGLFLESIAQMNMVSI